jgi:hypothetical protein
MNGTPLIVIAKKTRIFVARMPSVTRGAGIAGAGGESASPEDSGCELSSRLNMPDLAIS